MLTVAIVGIVILFVTVLVIQCVTVVNDARDARTEPRIVTLSGASVRSSGSEKSTTTTCPRSQGVSLNRQRRRTESCGLGSQERRN